MEKRIDVVVATGNLFTGHEEGIDEDASAQKYCDMLQDALEKEYPNMAIYVTGQHCSGAIETQIEYHGFEQFNDLEKAHYRIQTIEESLFNGGKWYVEI